MLRWSKLGRVFNPLDGAGVPWMREFAQCPTPFALDERRVRVYVAGRPPRDSDRMYVSHPGYVDLDRRDLRRVLAVAPQPLLELGAPGTFDEFGIMPGSVVRQGDEVRLYYTGWTRMESVPYTLAIGLAVSRDGGTRFERLGEGPLLGITADEPYLVTGPSVRFIDGEWHMWYLSGRKWLFAEGKHEPVYQVVHARSADGLDWRRDGRPVVPVLAEDECQDVFSPFRRDGRWHAVFAWRRPSTSGGAYRFGYAWSDDLATWQRDDARAGIGLADDGWDSRMSCYPGLIEIDGRLRMFYCGNDFGREGFGIAELEDARPR